MVGVTGGDFLEWESLRLVLEGWGEAKWKRPAEDMGGPWGQLGPGGEFGPEYLCLAGVHGPHAGSLEVPSQGLGVSPQDGLWGSL